MVIFSCMKFPKCMVFGPMLVTSELLSTPPLFLAIEQKEPPFSKAKQENVKMHAANGILFVFTKWLNT